MPTSSTPKTTIRASKPAPNTTVTVEAQATATPQVTQALQGQAFLEKLWNAKDRATRDKIVDTASMSEMADGNAMATAFYLAKVNPGHPALQSLSDQDREAMKQVVEKVDRTVLLAVARELARRWIRGIDEILQSYSDAGPLYAGTPLGVDVGVEAGIRTGEGQDLQRNGVVLGLRLDYASKTKPVKHMDIGKFR